MRNVPTWFISHTAKFSFGIRSPSFRRHILLQLCFLCLYLSCCCTKIPQQGSLKEGEVIKATNLRMGKAWWQEIEAAGQVVCAARRLIKTDA